jgi:hypothetical protein
MYIKGTDIEVGITRVSYEPLHPYAMCTLRLGIKKKHLKNSSLKPISNRYIKIPYICLNKFPSIKYNRLMYDATLLPSDPSLEYLFQKSSPLREGKYEESPLPHADLYEIVKTNIDGKHYYMHILKPLNPTLAGIGKYRSFSIFGIPELTYRMKKYDSLSKIVTFDTSPVRRAHVSVLRQCKTMKHLGGHTYRWEYSTVSLKGQTSPVDWCWIAGTNIHIKTCIHDTTASLYKWDKRNIFHWIPIKEVTTQQPTFSCTQNNLVTVFPEIYINGLPIPFEAKAPVDHPIHQNPIRFLHEEKNKYPDAEYVRDMQKQHSVITLSFQHQTWLAHVKNITLQPRAEYKHYQQYRVQDKQNYIADFLDRTADLKRSKVI